MSLVQRFARNTQGRDFVVGDVHVCFDYLRVCSSTSLRPRRPRPRSAKAAPTTRRTATVETPCRIGGQPWYIPIDTESGGA